MKRNWYAVITAKVLYDRNLTDTQKILYAVITNLCDEKGKCFPSNAYLADIMNTSEETIRRHLQALEFKRYVYRHMSMSNGRRQRYLSLHPIGKVVQLKAPHKIVDTPTQDYGVDPTELRGIITENNNKEENPLLVSTKVDTNNPHGFVKLWDMYGKKVGKQPAMRAWDRLKISDRKKVLEHVPKYVDNHMQADKISYLPHLSTYLNQKRYEESLPYTESKTDTGWELS